MLFNQVYSEVPLRGRQNPCSRHGREALDCAVLPVVLPSRCDEWWPSGGVVKPPSYGEP